MEYCHISRIIWRLSFLILGLNITDILLTQLALNMGMSELNPLVQNINVSASVLVPQTIVKMALPIALIALVYYFNHSYRVKPLDKTYFLASAIVVCLTMVYVGYITNNVFVLLNIIP
jgi:hypothetical protein